MSKPNEKQNSKLAGSRSWWQGLILVCLLSSGCALNRASQTVPSNQSGLDAAVSQQSAASGAGSSEYRTVAYQEEVEGVPAEMPAELPPAMDNHGARPLPLPSSEPQFRQLQDHDIQHAFPNQQSMNGGAASGVPEDSYRFSDQPKSGFAQVPPALPLSQYGGETWQGGSSNQPGGEFRSTYNNGLNVRGSEFRIPQRTATELMIDYKDENLFLNEEITRLNAEITGLKQDLANETTAHESTMARLEQMVRQERQLKEVIASLQVKVEDLEAANAEAKKQFDAVLQQIETNLDAALLNSMSRPTDSNAGSGQTP